MSYNIPQRIKTILQINRGILSYVIENAVSISFRNAHRICAGNDGEVDKVLQFFIDGTALMEEGFNRVLHPHRINVSIAAIFTHQTPYVAFSTPTLGTSHTCELADICILSTYGEPLEPPAEALGNAIFFQAKNVFNASPVDIQRQLYEHATSFAYDRPATLTTRLPIGRDLPGKSELALAYWELSSLYRFPNTTWTRWASFPEHLEPFSETLVDVLAGECGYGFRVPAVGEKSWSKIIFDLLEVSANSCVNRSLLKVRDRRRGTGTICRRILHGMHGESGPFVVRNSLAKILKNYSLELAELGKQIEAAPNRLDNDKYRNWGGDHPNEGDNGGAPPLGNERFYEGDGNGGVGNIILIHLTEMES